MNLCVRSKWIRTTTTVFVSAAILSGCLSGEDDTTGSFSEPGSSSTGPTTGTGPTTSEVVLTGSVGDGPVVGANIELRDSSGNLMTEIQSDSKAAYNITLSTVSEDFPLLLVATGGTDLVTNRAPDFTLKGVAFNTGAQSVANLSPFSTFTVELAKYMSGGITANNLENAQDTVSRALNSGLSTLVATGPIGTPIGAGNISEMVKASETLAEMVRRTRDGMIAAGLTTDADITISVLAADLTDGIIDGLGASDTIGRAAAISTIVSAQVLLESMANELHVLGTDATAGMRDAINAVSTTTPTVSLDDLPITAGMIEKARIGLAAAFSITEDPAIRELHAIVSGLQPGQLSSEVRALLPADYRNVLDSSVEMVITADDATIDVVNSIARTSGELEPANLAPTIQGTPETAVFVGSPYTFIPSASDPEGDPLTFSVVNAPLWMSFENATGRLYGTPAASDVGVYPNIVISVTDGEFSASLGAFEIIVSAVNTAPQISGTPSSTLDAGTAYTFTPSASDAEGDVLTFGIVNQPAWASFNTSTGHLSGVASNADAGIYSNILISVSDGEFSTSLAAFSITVNAVITNSPPQISGAPATNVVAGDAYTFTPSASDPEGDAMTFSIVNQPNWASFNATTGTLSGTPTNDDAATYSGITISVSDGEFSDSLTAFSITVTPRNAAPTISGTPSNSVNAGDNYSFTPTATDPDGDTLTFSISNQPAWASFNTSTGHLSGVASNADAATYSNIVISVSDGEFSSSLAGFSITVNAVITNSPPQISGAAATNVVAGNNYSFTPTATDPDGDTLTFSISNQPAWASFSTSTGTLSGTPSNADAATYSNVVISVSDGEFSSSLAAFSITVTASNTAPQLSGTPASSVNEGQNYVFTPGATDADGDALTFSITNPPIWASFDTSSGTLSGTPQTGDVGVYTNISITVSDGQASATLGPFDITVDAISLGSASLSWTAPTQNEDGTDLVDLAGYKLYWGTTPGSYPNSVTIDNPTVTEYLVENLAPGTYEFVATSFNTSGVESQYSGAATKVVQ
jgi:hypothetical protein